MRPSGNARGRSACSSGLVAPGDAVSLSATVAERSSAWSPPLVITQAPRPDQGEPGRSGQGDRFAGQGHVARRQHGGASSRSPSTASTPSSPISARRRIGIRGGPARATGTTAFGGTSGAAPDGLGLRGVAGRRQSRAHACGNQGPADEHRRDRTSTPTRRLSLASLAPITRIGGGEVRVDGLRQHRSAAWDAEEPTGSLSFGYKALDRAPTLPARRSRPQLQRQTREPTPSRRASATQRRRQRRRSTVSAPGSITVAANRSAEFNVELKVDVAPAADVEHQRRSQKRQRRPAAGGGVRRLREDRRRHRQHPPGVASPAAQCGGSAAVKAPNGEPERWRGSAGR